MCNAWNHRPDCKCGWGGEGCLTRSVSRGEQFGELQSYLIPNARCPVCQNNVYFYQSENGGKVFFDELGPPWLKHPCTDANTLSGYGFYISGTQAAYVEKKKAAEHLGWLPLIVLSITPLPPKFIIYSISAMTSDGVGRTFYTMQSKLKAKAPYYIKDLNENSFEISTVDASKFNFSQLKFKAFSRLADIGVLRKTIPRYFIKTKPTKRNGRASIMTQGVVRSSKMTMKQGQASKVNADSAMALALVKSGIIKLDKN